MGHSILD